MKKTLFILPVLMFAISAIAGTHLLTVKNDISGITLYLRGALVTRTANVSLKTGRNLLRFEQLSPKIDQHSIRVTAGGKVRILAVSASTDYLSNKSDAPRVKFLRDSLKKAQIRATELRDNMAAYQAELDMMLLNQKLGSTRQGVRIAELQQAAAFFRNRILEIRTVLSKTGRTLKRLESQMTRIKSQLNTMNAHATYPRTVIEVLITTSKPAGIPVKVEYLVHDAGWAPAYDIIATDIGQPVELGYNAKVFNKTAINWHNAHLKLSTADPELSASKPILEPWYLDYGNSGVTSEQANFYQEETGTSGQRQEQEVDGITYEQISVAELSAEFVIKQSYDIPTDGRPYLVEVNTYSLPAKYSHYAVPKINRDVFLLARITGWEDLDLVEGPANVYFNGSYVGKSYLNTGGTNDTLDLSLGRDNKVVVTRVKTREFNKTRIIGNNKKIFFDYEFEIKNNRKTPIEIALVDQVPISRNSDIEVGVTEASDADQDDNNGMLQWRFNIAPGVTNEIQLSFSVKYPRNRPVAVRRYRALSCPKF